MLIKIHVEHIINDEVVLDDILEFNSVEQFSENLKLAHQKWKSMHGKHCIINIYSDVISPGCCFYGATVGFNEYEIWEIIDINMQEKKKPNLIIDVNRSTYSSEPGGCYDEYCIVDSSTMNVYARAHDKDTAEIILKALTDHYSK